MELKPYIRIAMILVACQGKPCKFIHSCSQLGFYVENIIEKKYTFSSTFTMASAFGLWINGKCTQTNVMGRGQERAWWCYDYTTQAYFINNWHSIERKKPISSQIHIMMTAMKNMCKLLACRKLINELEEYLHHWMISDAIAMKLVVFKMLPIWNHVTYTNTCVGISESTVIALLAIRLWKLNWKTTNKIKTKNFAYHSRLIQQRGKLTFVSHIFRCRAVVIVVVALSLSSIRFMFIL